MTTIIEQPQLDKLLDDAKKAQDAMQALVAARFPGATIWHWYRARSAMRREDCRRNDDDQTRDVDLARDADIETAHKEYIRLLHIFFRARDRRRIA